MNVRKVMIIISIFLICVTFTFYLGYNARLENVSSEKCDITFKNLYETSKPGSFKATFKGLYGNEIRSFDVIKGDKVTIIYSSTVKSGSLTMQIKDPYGKVLSSVPINQKGSLKTSANLTGKVSIVIIGNNTSGYLKFSWKRSLF